MKWVEKGGRTVEEAVEAAVDELGVDRDQVEIEILDEGSKGFLGIIGNKQARVRVSVKDVRQEKTEAALAFLKGLLELLGNQASVEYSVGSEETVYVEFSGENLGLIIGRRGQMLDALQSLVNSVVNRQGEGEWVRFVLDAAGYRQRRENTLQELALRMAGRAKAQRRRTALEPMNAMERRIVHMALADDEEIDTHSEGDDPYRRVVIVPKRRS
jgi:spoIIIJ-associated protein